MKVTPRLREHLKQPLGEVAQDASGIPPGALIVAVGDTASDSIIKAGLKPALVVYDGMTHRQPVGVSETIASYEAKEHKIKNPAGFLADEVLALFGRLLKSGEPSRVYVDGEEDLTALAAIDQAPNGAYVVYGQPDEGLVVVKVDDKIKNKVKTILKEMQDQHTAP